jgi:hypothetical protein
MKTEAENIFGAKNFLRWPSARILDTSVNESDFSLRFSLQAVKGGGAGGWGRSGGDLQLRCFPGC